MKMTQKRFFRVCFQPITTLNCCTTCISWEIGSYNTQQSTIMNIRTFVAILSRNPQHDFPKVRGGGVKGRLELFRSFIRFGGPIRPYSTHRLVRLFDSQHTSLVCLLTSPMNELYMDLNERGRQRIQDLICRDHET